MIEERKEQQGAQPEEQINIQELLFRYLIHWPWFVASVVICVAAAWGYLRLATPVYNVSATVLIRTTRKEEALVCPPNWKKWDWTDLSPRQAT